MAHPDAHNHDPHTAGAIAELAYLTPHLPGVGGALKQRPTDFIVDEIPGVTPAGAGDHIHLYVEKEGLSTMELVGLLASHFRRRRFEIGFAGMKDKHAVTRQVLSVHAPGKTPEDFPELEHDRIRVLWTDLHTHKIRRGQLAGNRFSIRIRGVPPTAVAPAKRIMDALATLGAPNFFGEQRFGARVNNHVIGRACLVGAWEAAVAEILREDPPEEARQDAEARRLFAEGDVPGALRACPPACRAEHEALQALAAGVTAEEAIAAIDPVQRRFWVTAFQSWVFNAVLTARVRAGTLDRLMNGDVAWDFGRGAASIDVTAEALRDSSLHEAHVRGDVCATGPLWGPRMRRASGLVGEIEAGALRATGVGLTDFERFTARFDDDAPGARRPLRAPVRAPEVEGGVDEHGSFVRCAFELPPGAFATIVLREVMKPELTRGGEA